MRRSTCWSLWWWWLWYLSQWLTPFLFFCFFSITQSIFILFPDEHFNHTLLRYWAWVPVWSSCHWLSLNVSSASDLSLILLRVKFKRLLIQISLNWYKAWIYRNSNSRFTDLKAAATRIKDRRGEMTTVALTQCPTHYNYDRCWENEQRSPDLKNGNLGKIKEGNDGWFIKDICFN